ncbi:MAG TPA: aminotransferase class I/II-fold pyridoxal phosphate-dependent enzyme [Planctomycetota bacterium]|nr:aminotransferase class I/II-fold pyridoxal phosphate-dependent enzyme [Planctomycetota bacterium]
MPQNAIVHRAPRLPASRLGRPGDDPIFALNAEATSRRARGESIVNATVGSLLNDDGTLAVLPTAARAVKEVGATEWASYAPIQGPVPFLKAVADDVFGARRDLCGQAVVAATPGGTGALRHAIATFLEPGQSLLTTSYYWGPYQTIADEQERRVATFSMFAPGGGLDVDALDRAVGEHVAREGRALVILNDPCQNPTGYSMTSAEWEAAAHVVGRHAEHAPVAVLLDAAYAAYGPQRGVEGPIAALEPVADRALVLVAWSASKAFTHYGLRVGALVALSADATERAEIGAALTYACRGTWSNCNRGGMAAVTRLLTDPVLRPAVDGERAGLVSLLNERVAAFNDAAHAVGLRYPRYDGGFFTTVFAEDAYGAAERMRRDGVYCVPIAGALRLGLCSVARGDVARLVEAVARATA